MVFINMQTRRLCFMVALLFAEAGCEAENLNLPPVTWEGKNILFGTTQKELPCRGTLAALDHRVDILNDMLGTALPPGKKIRLYWLPDQMNRTPCNEGADGCASVIDNKMYAFVRELDAAEHEMTHLLLWPFGVGHNLFVEGLAECFGGLFHADSLTWSITREDVEALIENNRLNRYQYREAGMFACCLAQRFGVSKTKEAAFLSRPNWKRSDFNRGFEKIFGTSFDEVADDFATDEKGCYEIPLRCEAPEITLPIDGRWAQDIYIDCKDTATLGDTISGTMKTSRLIQITNTASYRVLIADKGCPTCDAQTLFDAGADGGEATAPFRMSLKSARCSAGPGCSKDYSTSVSPGDFHTVFLKSGLFELSIETNLDAAAPRRFSVEIQQHD
jgi:hypothetical protein